MSEENITNTTDQQTGTPTRVQNVDIEAIVKEATKIATREAEKKSTAVFSSMLAERGFDDDAIKEMVKEHKSKRQTPEQALKELEKHNAELKKQLEESANKPDPEKDALKAELTAIKQEKTLRKELKTLGILDDNITDELLETCRYHIGKFVSEDTDFESAAPKWLKETKLLSSLVSASKEEPKDPPPPYVVPGQGTVKAKSGMTKEEFKKLSYTERLKFKNSNPEAYNKIFN